MPYLPSPPPGDPHSWGAYVRRLRLAEDLSQVELARAIGIHHTTISEWESKGRNPDGRCFIRIVRYFGLNWDAAAAVVDPEADGDEAAA